MYYKKWRDAELAKIEEFFQGIRWLTFEEFCSKFKIKRNFLNYYGLCHAVPQKWINILKDVLRRKGLHTFFDKELLFSAV